MSLRSTRALMTRASAKKSSRMILPYSPVQATSLLVAYWRDLETRHATEPLVKDPPTRTLLDTLLSQEDYDKFEKSSLRPHGWDMLALRTKLIDDWLLHRGPFSSSPLPLDSQQRQVVNLGAGMCCRPYRLDMDHYNISKVVEVELDQALLETKHGILQNAGHVPNTDIQQLSIDLAAPETSVDTLRLLENKAGLDPSLPVDWLAEGLFSYLEPSTQHDSILELPFRFCDDIGSSTSQRMAISIFEPSCRDLFHHHGVYLPWQELVPAEAVIDRALKIGWNLEKHVSEDDLKHLYGRGNAVDLPGYNMIFLNSGG